MLIDLLVAVIGGYLAAGLGFWLAFKTFALPNLKHVRVTASDHLVVIILWAWVCFVEHREQHGA